MLLLILGLLDVIVGLSILFKEIFAGIVLALGFIALIKGIFSIIGGLMSKFFLDVLGWIDFIAGIILLLNFSIPFFWLAVIAKGVYSIIMGWK